MDIESDNLEQYSDFENPLNSGDSFIDHDVEGEDHEQDDEFIEHQEQAEIENLLEDNNYNIDEQEEISKKLLFCVQELGSIQTIEGKQVYIVGAYVESGLKDIIKMFKNENPEYPLVKYYLSMWNVLEKDLKAILLTQNENKGLVYQVLMVMAFLTEPIILSDVEKFRYKGKLCEEYDNSKILFTDKEFVNILVNELSECVKKPSASRNKFENDIIELILSVVRNSLYFVGQSVAKGKVYNDNQNMFVKIVDTYSTSGGVLDGLVYISSILDQHTVKLSSLLLESFYLVISKSSAQDIFGDQSDQDLYKRLKEMEKYRLSGRKIGLLSTRHSRFGANFEIRKNGKTKALVSDPKLIDFAKKAAFNSNKMRNMINRPKPRITTKVQKAKDNILKISITPRFKETIRKFSLDMLYYAFVPIVDSFYDYIYNVNNYTASANDVKMYIDYVNFGIETAILLTAQQEICDWYASAIQITILDFVYRRLIDCLSASKKDMNYPLLDSCVHYLLCLFEATKQLKNSNNERHVRNGTIVEKALFSKDVSKAVKLCFKLFLNFPNCATNTSLIKISDIYFYLLSDFSRNKLITIRTQTIREDYMADDEENAELENKVIYREKKFNFLTELTNFVDVEILQIYMEFLREDLYIKTTDSFKSALYNFFKIIIEDLEAVWYFYQIDILTVFFDFVNIENSFIIKHEYFIRMKALIMTVFKSFREKMSTNTLLLIESLFRFDSHLTLSSILNNYSGFRDNPAELAVNLDKLLLLDNQDVVTWNLDEDMCLAEYYFQLKDDPLLLEKLDRVLQIKTGVEKGTENIRKRIRALDLDNAPIETVRTNITKINEEDKNWDKIHNKMRKTLKKDGYSDRPEFFYSYMGKVFINFRAFREQYRDDISVSYSIVPKNKQDFELLEQFKPFLQVFGLMAPCPGYKYWRISSFTDPKQLDKLIEKSRLHLNNPGTVKAKKVSKKAKKIDEFIDNEEDEIIASGEESDMQSEESNIELELSESSEDERKPYIPKPQQNANLLELITGHQESNRDHDEDEDLLPKRRKLVKIKNMTTGD